jgi:uncharacterized membrane protein SpoIIM required for sporulation
MSPDELIRTRRADWERLTALVASARRQSLSRLSETELIEIGRLYRLSTSDLSIARRDFPNHDVSRYLNQLVATAHGLVYGGEPIVLRRIREFYLSSLPTLYWRMRHYVGLSALLLLAPWVLTFFVVLTAPAAADVLLDPGLISAIERNEAWWKDLNNANQVGTMQIMTNNLRVSFLAFAGGMFGGLLTVYVLVTNAMSFGAVFGLMQHHGHMRGLAEFVIGHGVIEIHMIIMAGAAGLAMGHGLLQPGLLSRRNALAAAARDGMRLLLGSSPGFILAALIEGFVSPSDTIPWAVKIAVGVGTGVLMLIYLVWGARRAAVRTAREMRVKQPG